jgi:hypothetical protein
VKACSFLKKRTKKLLFLRRLCGAYPSIEADAEGSKSLLLLFFRKEGLPKWNPHSQSWPAGAA